VTEAVQPELDQAMIADTPSDTFSSAKSRILVLASEGALFQGLLQAVKKRFPLHQAELLSQFPDEGELAQAEPCLVLVELGRGSDFAACAQECRTRFPHASLGLIINDADVDPTACEIVFAAGLVQGILPLSLKLEIWLAAMSLLISGGEYCPATLLRRPGADMPAAKERFISRAHVEPEVAALQRSAALTGGLTTRERQVLELVSKGFQNKLIADRMQLSEHTVKVHVHNLIKKLRVTNRTQAAAAFRAGFDLRATGFGQRMEGSQVLRERR
jgi:DNA-binding NarL/FixJ family response regulator